MSHIVGEIYLPKRAEDLAPGELVVYRKDSISTSLEDIIPHLRRSPRYDLAHKNTHVGSGDKEVTAFRKAILTSAGLEDMVFGELSENEVKQCVSSLPSLINPQTEAPYVESTLLGWISGETLAPQEYRTLEVLASHHEAFKKLASVTFYQDCQLYRMVHRGIMRYLASKGESAHETTGSSSQGGTLKPEIDIIMNEFMQSIDREYVLARVVAVQKVNEKKGMFYDAPVKSLYDGVGKRDGMKKTNYAVLANDLSILNGALAYAISEYLSLVHLIRPNQSKDGAFASAHIVASNLRYRMGQKTPAVKNNIENGRTMGITDELVNAVLRDLTSGRIDSALNLYHGEVQNAVTCIGRLVNALPPLYFRRDEGSFWEPLQSAKDMSKELHKRYGIGITKALVTISPFFQQMSFQLPHVPRTQSAELFKQNLVKTGEDKGFLTQSNVEQGLAKYDLAGLFRFIPSYEYF